MDCNANLRAGATLSHSPQVEKLQVISQIKRPLKLHTCVETTAFLNSTCIAFGYIPMNPNLKVKYLSTNSSDEDLMPESDADDET